MLIPGVERRREKRAFAPFEGLFFAAVLPDGRRAVATDDINQLLEHMLLRDQRFARGDLSDVTVGDTIRAIEIEINATRADPMPWMKVDTIEVIDMKAVQPRSARFPQT